MFWRNQIAVYLPLKQGRTHCHEDKINMIHNQNIIIFRTDAIKSDHACPSFSVCSIALFNHLVSIVLVRMELEGGVNPLTRTQQQFTAVESSHLQATIVNNKINQVAEGEGGGG